MANYSRPKLLWLICPLLLYMLGRALMLAHRNEMHDDPIVFALTDHVSLLAVGLICLLVLLATELSDDQPLVRGPAVTTGA